MRKLSWIISNYAEQEENMFAKNFTFYSMYVYPQWDSVECRSVDSLSSWGKVVKKNNQITKLPVVNWRQTKKICIWLEVPHFWSNFNIFRDARPQDVEIRYEIYDVIYLARQSDVQSIWTYMIEIYELLLPRRILWF